MKTFSVRRWAIGILLILTMIATTFASSPIAVYAMVDRVVFEPNENAPTRIQIWGTFSLSKTRYSANYAEPEKGYLRLCFAKEEATLDEAIARLGTFRSGG